MFTFNVRRLTLFLWLRGKKGELRAVGKAGKPLHGPATGGSFPLPSRCGPTPTPVFAKSADPDYSKHGGPRRFQSPGSRTHGPPCGVHLCNSDRAWAPPALEAPLEWDSRNSSLFVKTKRQNFLLNDLDYLKITLWAVETMVGPQD